MKKTSTVSAYSQLASSPLNELVILIILSRAIGSRFVVYMVFCELKAGTIDSRTGQFMTGAELIVAEFDTSQLTSSDEIDNS